MLGSAAFRTGIAPGGALAGPWVRNPLWTRARAVPSLDLRFADTKSQVNATTGASLVTFTRASSGTYVGSDGVLQTAVTNLLLRSEEFDNASWTVNEATITANQIVAPNGLTTADLYTTSANTGVEHYVSQVFTAVSSTIYTASVYVKAGTSSAFGLQYRVGSAWVGGNVLTSFNISTQVATIDSGTATASITPIGTGWFRCQITATSSVAGGSPQFRVATNDGGGTIYLWGAQLEQSSTVGEYIPTTSVINSAPRFDHNPTTGESLGLLVEEARTNLSLYSEDFTNAYWTPTDCTITPNESTAPDGTLTTDLWTNTASPGSITNSITKDGTSRTYTASLWVKGTMSQFTVTLDNGTTGTRGRVQYNLSTNTVGSAFNEGFTSTSGTLTPYPNGWVRLTLTTTTSTGTTIRFRPFFSGTGSTVRIWGAQVEEGAFPTSYSPTTTATATRAADVASVTGANFSSWYNQTEGTVFAEARTQQSAAGHVLAGFSTGSFASSAYLSKENTNFLVAAPNSAPSNLSVQLSSVSSNVGLQAALAFTAGTGSASAVMNGGTVGTDASTGIPITMSQMGIGTAPWSIGATLWNGTIKRLVYWRQRLPNNVLQAITQP